MTARKAKAKAKAKPRKAKEALPVVKLMLPPPWLNISQGAVDRSALKKAGLIPVAFQMPAVPRTVIPKGTRKEAIMANDEMIIEANAWAAQQVYNGAFFNGVTFLGYTYLAELAQRPEYRSICELLATEMTRKWIKLKSTSDDETKAPKIAQLMAEMKRLHVRNAFRKMVELDGFFGRSHLYLDTGSTDDRAELVMPIGNGKDAASQVKFKGNPGFLKAVKPVEPVWCYPAKYNASDPLKPDWYNPQSWYCQGKELHVTRLLKFVGREVPDLLKPSYAFGGLSLTQMGKPYVDNWLRTRQAVADLIWSFSVRGIKTNMQAALAGDGEQLYKRAALFSNYQTNQGLMLLDKENEDFFQVSTPLATLDNLQAQSQEHMCSVWHAPVIKLLGVQPAGLNASSAGELTTWREMIAAVQEMFFTDNLETVINFVQLSLWGAVDPDITFDYEPVEELTELEVADLAGKEAEMDERYINTGVLDPMDVRKRLGKDPDSIYDGLDVNALPDQTMGDNPEDQLDLDGGLVGARETRLDDRDADRDESRTEGRRDTGPRPARTSERPSRPESQITRTRTPREKEGADA